MPDLSKYKTAHQLAKELLAGPDSIVVIPTPTFDMPGCFHAFPVMHEVREVDGVPVVSIGPDIGQTSANAPKPEAPAESPKA